MSGLDVHPVLPGSPPMTRLAIRLTVPLLLLTALLLALPAADAKTRAPGSAWDGKTQVAHEWGTFTSVQGSDGVVLDGLMHEETDLPEFVYDLRDEAGVTGVSPKMETPVVYFHAPKGVKVRVDVGFPRGTITQWYPAAKAVNHVGPSVNGIPAKPDGRTIAKHAEGYIRWGTAGDLQVLARDAKVSYPPVAKDDPWRFCRQTAANPLRVCTVNHEASTKPRHKRRVAYEHEHCLFYRGLGDFPLPLKGRVARERIGKHAYEVEVELENRTPAEPLTHLFLVWVKNGQCGFHYVPDLKLARTLEVTMPLRPKARATAKLVEELATALTKTGLYRDEALAMARTWQQGYFQDEGLRVLYVLPTAYIDRELPLTVKSLGPKKDRKPWKVVRTFVGRTELLSPERERTLRDTVEALAGTEADARRLAEATLKRYGRFAVPYLNRAKALTKDATAKARIDATLAALRLTR